jgi:hypothetical protein
MKFCTYQQSLSLTICKPFKGAREAIPTIGWRNLFLGSINVYKYGLMVSGSHVVKLVEPYSTVCTPLGIII